MAVTDRTRSTAVRDVLMTIGAVTRAVRDELMTIGAVMSVHLDWRGCPPGIHTPVRSHNNTTKTIGFDGFDGFYISFKAVPTYSGFSVMVLGQDHPFLFLFLFLRALHWAARRLSPFFSKVQKRKKFIIPPKALEASFLFSGDCFDITTIV